MFSTIIFLAFLATVTAQTGCLFNPDCTVTDLGYLSFRCDDRATGFISQDNGATYSQFVFQNGWYEGANVTVPFGDCTIVRIDCVNIALIPGFIGNMRVGGQNYSTLNTIKSDRKALEWYANTFSSSGLPATALVPEVPGGNPTLWKGVDNIYIPDTAYWVWDKRLAIRTMEFFFRWTCTAARPKGVCDGPICSNAFVNSLFQISLAQIVSSAPDQVTNPDQLFYPNLCGYQVTITECPVQLAATNGVHTFYCTSPPTRRLEEVQDYVRNDVVTQELLDQVGKVLEAAGLEEDAKLRANGVAVPVVNVIQPKSHFTQFVDVITQSVMKFFN